METINEIEASFGTHAGKIVRSTQGVGVIVHWSFTGLALES